MNTNPIMLRFMHRIILLIAIAACATGGTSRSGSAPELRVLFVGNSLTYFNDLPAMVREIAAQDNVKLIHTSVVAGNFSLEDHWAKGEFQAAIRDSAYDFVVAQQGPSALPESRALLVEYTARFARACAAKKARMALYMVWPSAQRSFDQKNVIASYTAAAQETGSMLCPAGVAWQHAWEADPALALYGPDQFHPSRMGSLLAALTIYGALLDKTDLGFVAYDTPLWKNDLSPAQFAILKAAAAKALLSTR